MGVFIALLRKDLLTELRTKETITVLLCLGLLLSVITAYGLNAALLNPDSVRQLYPTLLWLVFLFSATVSMNRSFEQELDYGALEGILLAGASPYIVFLSKALSNVIFMFAAQAVSIIALAILMNVDILIIAPQLMVLSLVVIFGYSALATLLSGITSSARLRGMLLPLILLPVLFPLLFAALELTSELVFSARLNLESAWFSLLIGLDVVYVVLGVNLFEYVVKE